MDRDRRGTALRRRPPRPNSSAVIRSLAILLSCQLAGEIAARVLALPVPGPVLGIALLLLGFHLLARRGALTPETVDATDLGRTAAGLLQSLGLLFVPAGVGVVEHLGLFTRHGLALLAALVGSTLATLVVTALVFGALRGWLERRSTQGETPRAPPVASGSICQQRRSSGSR